MRAAVMTGRGVLAVEATEPLPLGPRDVAVHIAASGVCHSDKHVLDEAMGAVNGPMVLGHEGCGTVLAVGDAVSEVAVGDRVVLLVQPVCGVCRFCVGGQTELCTAAFEVGTRQRVRRHDGSLANTMGGLGTFAERAVVDAASLIKVQTTLPDEQLALLGCGVMTGACAVFNTAQVQPGDTVAVFGCGGVGQAIIQAARIAGASRIIAIDLIEAKRDTALRNGATDVIDPATQDAARTIRKLSDGGVDHAFEAIGLSLTLRQAFDATRRGGAIIAVGLPPAQATVELPVFRLVFEGKRLLGSLVGSAQARRDIPRLIRLAESGALDLSAMVGRTIALDEVGDALATLDASSFVRTVVVP